jgi:competence/damage-inducible protein CinA-like protein
MPAEIIAIGTELLLGEIQDTNTQRVARALRSIGLDLYRSTVVGDNVERISTALRESLARADAVITCGGLGPTVDDPTRQAVAAALGRPLEFREELWGQIQERFARFGRRPTENNRRQAYLPQGAIAIENRVGTAPAFYVEVDSAILISLPGVPAELEVLLEETVLALLKSKRQLQDVIKTRILRTATVGESDIDNRIHDLERLSNPTVGLSAHPGRVDIRVTAKARTESEAEEAVSGLEATLRQRLGGDVYGVDEESLEAVVGGQLRERGWRIASVESGTFGALASALALLPEGFAGGLILPVISHSGPDELRAWQIQAGAETAILVSLEQEENRVRMRARYAGPFGEENLDRTYGGPLPSAAQWAVSIILDHFRRTLLKTEP